MKFFKPEDFRIGECSPLQACIAAAEHANAKLKREGKGVYAAGKSEYDSWDEQTRNNDKFKALLINIEPIEACTHPAEKVNITSGYSRYITEMFYRCQCGAKVKLTFVEEK